MRKTLKRILKAWLVVLASLAVIGCLIFAEFFFGIALFRNTQETDRVSLPELSGRYSVGRRFVDWVDPSRSDPFRKSAKRELMASVWYPAQLDSSSHDGVYLSGKRGLSAARFQSMMLRVRVQSFRRALVRNPLPKELIAGIRTHVVDNAAISGEQPNFPVLLFSPGYGAMPTEYTAILEDIASHGYVIVGINPTDFVPVTMFQDDRTVYAPVWSPSLYEIETNFPIWVQDMLFALNAITSENSNAQSPFFDRLDLTRVGAFGHSMGGAASAGACQLDPRIGAGLNLDGAPHGAPSTWKFPQPFMLVQSGKRAYRGEADEAFLKSLTIGFRVVVKGSTHHAFTDEVMLPIREDRKEALIGSVSGPRMVQLTSFVIRAFFDSYLRKKPSNFLSQVSGQFPH